VTTLNAVFLHLGPEEADEHLALLRALAPDERFVVLHGGPREACAAMREPEREWIADPGWRGPPRSFQSYHELFAVLRDRWLAREPELDAVHLLEFDQLPLVPDFAERLRAAADATGADLLAKRLICVNGTNWAHYGRFRRDPALLAHLAGLSVRDDPTRLYGMLGSGMWLSRRALEAYTAVPEHPPCYGELYVPTLLHHLGLRVVDGDLAPGGLFRATRWEPPFGVDEGDRARLAGAPFVHPVKDPAARRELLRRAAAAVQSERVPRPTG
jgi:hypothetical protein